MTSHSTYKMYNPFIKALGRPLDACSAHHPCVAHWPTTEYRRIINQSPNKTEERKSLQQLAQWLSAPQASSDQWEHDARFPRARGKRREATWWCVLPWHPAYVAHSPVATALQNILSFSYLATEAFGVAKRVQISWKNSAPSDYRKHNSQALPSP